MNWAAATLTRDMEGFGPSPAWETRRTQPAPATKGTRQADGRYRYILSSETADLVGDIVVQSGLRPVSERLPAQLDHAGKMGSLIGWWSDIRTEGKRTTGTLNLLSRGVSEAADFVRRLHEDGQMQMAASIGFVPDMRKGAYELIEDKGVVTGIRFLRSQLVEASVVVVPAHPEALSERQAPAAARRAGLSPEEIRILDRADAAVAKAEALLAGHRPGH